jgi:hypothetical protein
MLRPLGHLRVGLFAIVRVITARNKTSKDKKDILLWFLTKYKCIQDFSLKVASILVSVYIMTNNFFTLLYVFVEGQLLYDKSKEVVR